jgi:hypothetical protein
MQDTIKQLWPDGKDAPECHKTQPHVILANQIFNLILYHEPPLISCVLAIKGPRFWVNQVSLFWDFVAAGHSPDCK